MEKFEVDLDTESIWLDDAWHTRDELAEVIQSKLKAGDYQIAQPSQAIELLSQAVGTAKELNVRISGEISEALEAAAQDLGRTTSSIVRQLLDDWLFPKDEEDGGEEEDAQEDGVVEGEEGEVADEAQEDEIAEGDDVDTGAEESASESDEDAIDSAELDDGGPFNESTPTGSEEDVPSEGETADDGSDEFFQ